MNNKTVDKTEKIDNILDLPLEDLIKFYEEKGESDIKKKDKLDFRALSESFLEDIFGEDAQTQENSKDIYKKKKNENYTSKLNLIQGDRGSGKTTFTKILFLKLYERSKNEGKKFIPIVFNPRYLDGKKIDESFFELLTNKLLQHRRSNNLRKSTRLFINAIKEIDNQRIKLITNILNIGEKDNQSIDFKINEIAKIINQEYKDCQIAIRIDEIDRLDQIKLMELGQLLDIIKKLTELCPGNQCISFFSWTNLYISQINLPGSNNNDNNFEGYFSRYKFAQINVYEKSIPMFIDFVLDNLNFMNGGRRKKGIRSL